MGQIKCPNNGAPSNAVLGDFIVKSEVAFFPLFFIHKIKVLGSKPGSSHSDDPGNPGSLRLRIIATKEPCDQGSLQSRIYVMEDACDRGSLRSRIHATMRFRNEDPCNRGSLQSRILVIEDPCNRGSL